jgi:dihydroorotate dehydrogenase
MVIFISPPFGNYLNLRKACSIRGSFTLEPREGLIGQIFKTLRYSFKHNGWINKIGLRNPGIDYAIQKYGNDCIKTDNIISIAILQSSDMDKFLNKIPDNVNLEVNVSCPNAEKSMIDENIHKFINDKRKWCVIKVSPLVTKGKLDSYYKVGFRQFHVSNTLPTERGGLSGKTLIPYNKESIEYLRKTYPDTVIIGGGGIQDIDDALMYKKFGADHISVSTLCFNPYKFMKFYNGKF